MEGFNLSLFLIVVVMTSKTTAEPRFQSRLDVPSEIVRNITDLFRSVHIDPILSASGNGGGVIYWASDYHDLLSEIPRYCCSLRYLGKFGWVEPKNWVAISPRTIGSNRNETFLAEANETEEVEASLNDNDTLSNVTFSVALQNFQQANKLDASGRLDEDTLLKMTEIRCGVPDQTTEGNLLGTPSSSWNNEIEEEISPAKSLGELSELNDVSAVDSRSDLSADRKRRSLNLLDESNGIRRGESLVHRLIDESRSSFVSEGELPEQSRAESIEGILSALRREKSLNTKENQEEPALENPTFTPLSNSSLLTRIQSSADAVQYKKRTKRSRVFNRYFLKNNRGLAFAKRRITWRLIRQWPSRGNPFMNSKEIWFTVKLAFRMWSEIIPREFQEDNLSPANEVDILIGFGEGRHNHCPVRFATGSFVSEYAHAWPLPKAEIHFNDVQAFVPVNWIPTEETKKVLFRGSSSYPISLLKVALHEIGHSLGLTHNENRVSIMNPFHLPIQNRNIVEVSNHDRGNIRKIYGTCDLSFDVAFDWVRRVRQPDNKNEWKFNTYFFRKTWYWLYENRAQRPRYGDPKLTAAYWRGVLERNNDRQQKLDGAVHIRDWSSPDGKTFFFKGNVYVEYDNDRDRTLTHNRLNQSYPRRIADDFPGIPHPIDTAFFNAREQLLYFFKNDRVYRFNWKTQALLDSSSIAVAFPGWGGAAPLANNIDAAYYSYAYEAYYFFKGTYYWKLADQREKMANLNIKIPYNAVGPKRKISSKWKYICDVGQSELVLALPSS